MGNYTLTFQKPILTTVSTSQNEQPIQPTFKLDNPIKQQIFINQLQVFPKTNFGEKAIL